jgi:hypothetical protein
MFFSKSFWNLNSFPKGKLFLLNLYSRMQSLGIFGGKEGLIWYFSKLEQPCFLKRIGILESLNRARPIAQRSPACQIRPEATLTGAGPRPPPIWPMRATGQMPLSCARRPELRPTPPLVLPPHVRTALLILCEGVKRIPTQVPFLTNAPRLYCSTPHPPRSTAPCRHQAESPSCHARARQPWAQRPPSPRRVLNPRGPRVGCSSAARASSSTERLSQSTEGL